MKAILPLTHENTHTLRIFYTIAGVSRELKTYHMSLEPRLKTLTLQCLN